jgi:phosphopantothenoylcysteine decarboxylase/phosphopantothenate--cysteine ligase
MRILITAGPTREHLDDVRFLSNASSGRMGFALAAAARAEGHSPSLILGPVDLPPPPDVPVTRVTSAQEMHDAVLAALPAHDALVMAAAVADYRPKQRAKGKPRRSAGPPTLELVPTPDILAAARAVARPGFVIVGFALEAGDLGEGARRKLAEKRVDWIVADAPAAIGVDVTTAEIHGRSGLVMRLDRKPKADIALAIIRQLGATAV